MPPLVQTVIVTTHPNTHLIRYADDLVALHPEHNVIEQVQQTMSQWLAPMGLALKPSKTRITHTLTPYQEQVGIDFLGFHIRQFKVDKTHSGKTSHRPPRRLGFKTIIQPSKEAQRNHQLALKAIIKPQPATSQERLIAQLNPVIRGWCNYHATVCSQQVFSKMEHLTFTKLYSWAKRRHPRSSRQKIVNKYWRLEQGQWLFAPVGGKPLYHHDHTPIKRHIKVKGTKSPYDGDWLYWTQRKSKQPGLPKRIAVLLNRQAGQCAACGLYFNSQEMVEVDHIIPRSQGGKDAYHNWQLLHTHCHHRQSAQQL